MIRATTTTAPMTNPAIARPCPLSPGARAIFLRASQPRTIAAREVIGHKGKARAETKHAIASGQARRSIGIHCCPSHSQFPSGERAGVVTGQDRLVRRPVVRAAADADQQSG
jgi:hypothetical protein